METCPKVVDMMCFEQAVPLCKYKLYNAKLVMSIVLQST